MIGCVTSRGYCKHAHHATLFCVYTHVCGALCRACPWQRQIWMSGWCEEYKYYRSEDVRSGIHKSFERNSFYIEASFSTMVLVQISDLRGL